MKWNVFTYNCQTRNVDIYNIFDHCGFLKDCKKAAEDFDDDKDEFIEEIDRSLMYYFWSKCEWEILITDFPPSQDPLWAKIDVYNQVKLNWICFCEYIWRHRGEI